MSNNKEVQPPVIMTKEDILLAYAELKPVLHKPGVFDIVLKAMEEYKTQSITALGKADISSQAPVTKEGANIESISEEIWDKYSHYIGDSLSDFEMVSGRSILLPGDYKSFAKDIVQAVQQATPPPTKGEGSASVAGRPKEQSEVDTLKGQVNRLNNHKETMASAWKYAAAELEKWQSAIADYLDPTSEEYKKFIEDFELTPPNK